MFFVLGLLLIPVGILVRRRKLRQAGHLPAEAPKIDLAAPHIRRVLLFVGAATLVNIVLMGTATIKGVDYMDSSKFCGLTCHTPMITEYPGLHGFAPLPGGLRPVPHRARHRVLHAGQAGRGAPGVRGGVQQLLPAHPQPGGEPCARPGRPARPATGRRSSPATRSWSAPTTPRTPPAPPPPPCSC